MINPAKSGMEPITSEAVTITAQSAIGPGFFATAQIEVQIAVSTPTRRSSNRGKATTLSAMARTAKTKPTPNPTPVIVQPAEVVSTSWRNADSETGTSGPSVTI